MSSNFLDEKPRQIGAAIRCPEGWVMVFDCYGEQIPEYQGQYHLVKDIILNDAPPEAVFAHFFDSEPELRKVPRNEW